MKSFDLDKILNKSEELFAKKDSQGILAHINNIKKFLVQDIDLIQKAHLAYSIGTSYEDVITIKQKEHNLKCEEFLEKALYYFDYAFDLIGNIHFTPLYEQLLTNYGNACRNCGRIIKSIEIYSNIKKFPMAQGNLGVTLSRFAPLQYDENHIGIFFKEGYKNLCEALKNKEYLKKQGGADKAFERELKDIEKIVRPEYLNKTNNFRKFSWGKTRYEKKYRKWVAINHLFLNTMNDIFDKSFVSYDFLHLPTMRYNNGCQRDEFDCAIMNEIKQEYVSTRYRLFESLNYLYSEQHIADREVEVYELTNNLMCCNYYENLIRCCFRDFYSILDKIAYFVNQYFNLEIDLNSVSFRRVMNDDIIKEKTKSNLMIRGLYWTSKDIFEDKYITTKYKSENYAKLRNYLEHRLVVTTVDEKQIEINENEIIISQHELFEYTFNLMKLVRECIIYLILAINIEEKEKDDTTPTTLKRTKILDIFK